MRALAVETLSIRSYRNLESVDLELGPRFNVIAGDNGQGKTSLIEALYVLATSRSFRTAKLADLVAHGQKTASVRACVREDGATREQSMGLRAGMRAARIDGKRPPTLAAYAVRTPVVVFHPGSVALSSGGGSERRKLLDRLALYLSPASMAEAEAFAKALRSRQRTLELRGETAADLDGWEQLVARHGLAVMQARSEAAGRLLPQAVRSFARIGAPGLELHARYEPSAPRDVHDFAARLAAERLRDRARGSASTGPHRDDIAIELGSHPARGIASQGQHRAVVLALRLAEIEVVAEARGVRPILLLDDVSSELDRARTAALFAALREERGQVILTTTRPELIETEALFAAGERSDFEVVAGRIQAQARRAAKY